uniref:Transcription factor IIIC subunit 5 HTH domain-containing protein n=1 Tax=Romanomermis culicivorax TaxID=13658 RepID=A0A915JSQ0_ROMCU
MSRRSSHCDVFLQYYQFPTHHKVNGADQKIFSAPRAGSASLSLDYHPENFYSKPTIARKRQSTFIIIRARRKKFSTNTPTIENQPSTSTSKNGGKLEIQILGVANAVHHFNVIFDFQYLPIRRLINDDSNSSDTRGEETSKFESIVSKLFPQTLEESINWFEEDNLHRVEDVGLILPPFVYSKFFASTPYILCRETERRVPVPENMPMGSRTRPQRVSHASLVHFTDSVYPTIPSQEASKRAFQERPMWTRSGLLYRTSAGHSCLKDIVQGYGYYFLNGPWARTWCRFGYDPRKDPESRQFQTITYVTSIRELIFTYKPGCLPVYRQMFYQLCDIRLPIVEQILVQPTPGNSECHPVYGWFTGDQIETIRAAIKADVEKTVGEVDQMSDSVEEGESD